MTLGRTRGVALQGIEGALVYVEAALEMGLPKVMFSGLPDAACRQAPDRIAAAAMNSGVSIPKRRLTVNLSPASIPKVGSGWDLPIAIAALAASEAFPADVVEQIVHIGELGLDGSIRPVRGVLPVVLTAARLGVAQIVVPAANASEAALVPGICVVPARHLRDLVARYRAIGRGESPEEVVVDRAVVPDGVVVPDLRDVVGQDEGRLALEIAAAGRHHLFLSGPPGAGKTMLAERLPSLLPDLESEQALQVTAIHSVLGALPTSGALIVRPPFVAPHHGASMPAIVGGGSGFIRPGAISKAHHGVLFLDEAPEFKPGVLQALRQPVESGEVVVARASGVVRYPARFQLVLAANPCPCGRAVGKGIDCSCSPRARRDYMGKLAGPLLDRVDLQLQVRAVSRAGLFAPVGECSATVAARVATARGLQGERLAGTPWRLNGDVPGPSMRGGFLKLPPAATVDLERALERGILTLRGYDRVLKIAWTRKTRIMAPMSTTDAATIYTRQSFDATGEGLAVDRQLLACRKLCADHGWTVTQEFSDNDISASTGKHRPGFEALLKSDPVRIVVWHMDRLVRLSRELERVIDLNVNVHAVASGHIDLSNPAGRAVAKTVTAWAQYEGEQKSRRQLASNEQAAKAGRRVGGRRPFGFDAGGMELVEAEAEAVRDGYDKLLGGVPLAEIARDWNARGFVSGQLNRKGEPSPFRADSVRTILENGRNAGLRIYKGEIMAKAIWPSIVSEETWRAAVALLSDPKRRSGPRGNARAFLTGVAICGVCRAHCHSGGAARPGHPAYRCSGSRGHIARMTGPIDDYVTMVAIARLARPDARDLMTVAKGPSVAALRTDAAALRSRLEALALNFADGVLTESQLRAATTRTRGNLAAVEGKLGDLGRVDVLGPLVGARNTRAVWDAMSLSARRAVVGTLMTPVIHQVGRGVRTFRPESVEVVWHEAGRTVIGVLDP